MAGTITLEVNQWRLIKEQLDREYPRSYTVISSATRCELGFTIRTHKHFFSCKDEVGEVYYDPNGSWMAYKIVICLDFYDDAKETFFRLKYL